MYQKYYQDFIKGHRGKIHMAGHSHHFWPDSAKDGLLESWDKAASLSDETWNYFFETLLPDNQKIISNHLNFSRPADIAFASNTHELLFRLISSYDLSSSLKILTTESEFHSFSRQLQRLEEYETVTAIKCSTKNINNFKKVFLEKIKTEKPNFIFLSQVFFDSGISLPNDFIAEIIEAKDEETIFVLDGYHAYCAIDTDISQFEDHLYYLAGGYKYAQAGAGICFMTLPKSCDLRPLNTGWFASFETLENPNSKEVSYSDSGMRFWGATIDQTAFFRFRAVWNNFKKEAISLSDIQAYVYELKLEFLKDNPYIDQIIMSDPDQIGSFVTLSFQTPEEAKALHLKLKSDEILTDFRGESLRFGITPYLIHEEIRKVKAVLTSYKK